MAKKKKTKKSTDEDMSAGMKAGLARRGIRAADDLAKQADDLRHVAIGLDQYADELRKKKIKRFEMDGHTKFDRAHKLLTDYLVQVNRWIGFAEHGR